jgi:hypothetical protein
MNKEQQELLNDAYENYKSTTLENDMKKSAWELTVQSMSGEKFIFILSQEEFIGRVITNPDFAKQWGVTIYTVVEDGNTRVGINYNNKTIESYE